MDPKQTQGQNGDPGAPQGIFSFSSGGATGQANQSSPQDSGVLSTGANVSRTIDSLNNRKSATSNSPFAKHQFQKVAPKTGDILIDPSGNIITEPKKGLNRGRLIQAGFIFVGVALVALVVFSVIMIVNNNLNKPKTSVASNYQEAFNRYANWMVYGEDSTSSIDLSNASQKYYAQDVVSGDGNQIQFFEIAKGYYDDFSSSFFGSDLSSYNAMASAVLANGYDLIFFFEYLKNANFSNDDLLNMYLQYGDEFQTTLTGIYDQIAEQSNSAEDYAELGAFYAAELQDWFNILNNSNCIKNSMIDETCRRTVVAKSPDVNNIYSNIINLQSDMDERVTVTYNKLLLNLGVINEQLISPTPNIEQSNVDDSENYEANEGDVQ